jgi:hypothetical protein
MSKFNECLTLKFPGLSRILYTPIAVSLPAKGDPLAKHNINCIWDTGCSTTTITKNVVDALGLKQTGVTKVNTASDTGKLTETYEIDLYISDRLFFKNITVNLGKICDGIDCLLGMDIIGTGDLSITNLNGNTCMSFRHPSLHEIDFLKNPHFGTKGDKNPMPSAANNYAGTPRNATCPCGSNKQYKRCHGKS